MLLGCRGSLEPNHVLYFHANLSKLPARQTDNTNMEAVIQGHLEMSASTHVNAALPNRGRGAEGKAGGGGGGGCTGICLASLTIPNTWPPHTYAALQAKAGLVDRVQQLEAQQDATSAALKAAEGAASSAQQEAAVATAAMRNVQAEHQSRVDELEANLAAAQEQQTTSSQLATEAQIQEQIVVRLKGDATSMCSLKATFKQWHH